MEFEYQVIELQGSEVGLAVLRGTYECKADALYIADNVNREIKSTPNPFGLYVYVKAIKREDYS